MDTGSPSIRELPADVARALLARHHVGRLAFTFNDRVDIQPIHFVVAHGRIFFRTSEGSKLTSLRHHPWVALEVDEVDGLFDWRSAVAYGTVYELQREGDETNRIAFRVALTALRTLTPALRDYDPAPHRDVILELAIDRVTGRESTTRGPRHPRAEP